MMWTVMLQQIVLNAFPFSWNIWNYLKSCIPVIPSSSLPLWAHYCITATSGSVVKCWDCVLGSLQFIQQLRFHCGPECWTSRTPSWRWHPWSHSVTKQHSSLCPLNIKKSFTLNVEMLDSLFSVLSYSIILLIDQCSFFFFSLARSGNLVRNLLARSQLLLARIQIVLFFRGYTSLFAAIFS